jgi:predicted ATPase/DNA-binding NarL/FixJ family response regulator
MVDPAEPIPIRALAEHSLQDQFGTPVPAPLTSFIGREADIAAVSAHLRRPEVRLLTLTGPGGIGKTRLALRALETLAGDHGRELAFVPLEPVRDPDLALATVAQALGIPEAAGTPLLPSVRRALADRPLLLVLDNLEHLVDGVAPWIGQLLATCPRLTVLATSRMRLEISGEQVYRLGVMDRETARALFAARATAAEPAFSLTPESSGVVDAICERLDHLPLAIELAAARVNVLPPRALLARLDQKLEVLTGGPRDAPARLRDMRGTIAWSHDLLTEPEQALFRRLGVFAGGFTLQAAQAVADDGHDVLTGVSTLVSASLVIPADGASDEPRFTMLETIREYALERLAESGEEPSVRERHARHMVSLGERLWDTPDWPRLEPWLEQLRPEIGNFRLTLAWTLHHDASAAVQLAGALDYYWAFYGYVTEGRAWLTRALQASPDAQGTYRARALIASGRMAVMQGEYHLATGLLETAEARLRKAVARSPNRDNTRLLTLAVTYLGDSALARGELDRARTLFTEMRVLAERHAVPMHATIAIMNLGRIAQETGDLPLAQELLDDALARHQTSSGPIGVAYGHQTLGSLLLERGNHALASAHFRQAFATFADAAHLGAAAAVLEALAGTAVASQPDRATRLIAAAATIIDQGYGPRPASDERIFADMLETTRAQLGEAAFTAAWEAGTRLTLDEVRAEVDALVEEIASAPESLPVPAATHGLTPREIEVLRLVAAGRSNREIADALSISVPTVKRHVTTILGKLGLPSRSAATAWAHTHEILNP